MLISRDSKLCISVQKIDDQNSVIEMHDINTQELTFQEVISGRFIKIKEVVQLDSGKLFAAAYIDDGLFRVKILTQHFA